MDSEPKFSDYMGCAQNREILEQLDVGKGERVVYSCRVSKFNRWGMKQDRTLLLTNDCLYNIKKNSVQRRINVNGIKAVTKSTQAGNQQFIVHIKSEYDYVFESDQIQEIFEAVKLVFWQNNKINLPVYGVPDRLMDYATSKKDITNGVEVHPRAAHRLKKEDRYEEEAGAGANGSGPNLPRSNQQDEILQWNDEVQ
jgi:hypothetical protein